MKIDYSIYPTLLDSFYWYKRMPEKNFHELIDKINRIKKPIPIAALKGVQFEDVVNKLIIKDSVYFDSERELYITENFEFPQLVVDKIANKLQRAVKQQQYMEAVIKTPVGNVKLYGFVDYVFPKMHVDLKTTGKYFLGKFKNNNQHKAYSLISKTNGNPIEQFNYLVTDFNRMFIETYDCTEKLHEEIIDEICHFTEFLTHYKDIITDNKIFGK